GALTVTTAVFVTPRYAAEIVGFAVAPTAVVTMVNDFDVCPAGMVTLAGTDAAASELLNAICAPPAGAAPVSVTVPVADPPPATVAGATVTLDNAAGVTDSEAVLLTPKTAEITVEAAAATGCVVTENGADIAFPGTVTIGGTVAAAVFDELSATGTPPAGAFDVNVTVPLTVTPPTALDAPRLRLLTDAETITSVPVALLAW